MAPDKANLYDAIVVGTGISGGDWFRWVWSLTDWVDRKDAHPMLRPSTNTAASLGNDLRIAIAADWGTGLYGAPKIAETIRRMAAQHKFDLAMHLGDVYYSGTEKEVDARFLKVWPTDAATIVKYEYRLLASNKTSTMQKELGQAGAQAFEFVGLTVAKTLVGGAEVVTILRRKR